MKSHVVRRLLPIAAIGLVVAVVLVAPTTTAETGTGPAAQAGTVAVTTVPPGTRLADDPGKKGDTYYWIEAQSVRSTTRFGDTIVTAERRSDGKLHAKVTDRNGNEHGDLVSSSSMVQYRAASGEMLQARNESSERPTLHWASRQAYGLASDGAANLVWDAGVMRPQRAARREIDAEADELETEWTNGVVAKLEKRDLPPRELAPGRRVGGAAWVTTLTVNGVPMGHGVWVPKDQVFGYTLPGLITGLVWTGPEHLKPVHGGWPFKPDLAWLNFQTIAAYHFRTLAAKQGSVASACETARPNRIAQFFFPTVHAEPGCDGLHYLDGTIFRACCDDHDRCYSKSGCTSQSWWQIWKSWTCDMCNASVVACFAYAIDIDVCMTRAWFNC